MQFSDYLAIAAFLISMGGTYLVLKESVHRKRQRRLLISYAVEEAFTGWGDDLETAWMRVSVRLENRSPERYRLESVSIVGPRHFGVVMQPDGMTRRPLQRRSTLRPGHTIDPETAQDFSIYFSLPRSPDGASVSFAVTSEFKIVSPLQGFDFLNLSSRRVRRRILTAKYSDINETKSAIEAVTN